MPRLIDADEFKEIILTYGKAGYRALPIEKISELIDGQSTAYDVDKVVGRLEEDAKYFQSEADELAQVGNWGTATELQGKAAAYRDAAKTVKSGGID